MDLEILFSLLQTFIALLAVLALAYLVLRFGKRFASGNASFVKILEKTSLSNNSYLAVAQIGSNYHLISVTTGDIKILKDLDVKEVEEIMEQKKRQFEAGSINKWMQARKKT